MHVEPEALEDMHLRDDDGVLEVVERVPKVGHGGVRERVLARGERVRGALGEQVVHVDEVADAEGALFEFGREVERAHAHVLSGGLRGCMRGEKRADPDAELLHRGGVPEAVVDDLCGGDGHLFPGCASWVRGWQGIWGRTV